MLFRPRQILKPCIQWIPTFAAFLMILQVGMIVGWSSPNVARYSRPDAEIRLTETEVSWVASIQGIGALFGAGLGAAWIELRGSRATCLLACLLAGASWLCLLAASSALWLCAGRLLAGLPVSLGYCCFSMFLGEVSAPRVRGTLVSLAGSGYSIGVLAGTLAETYLPPRVSGAIYLGLAALAALLFASLADSPYLLVRRGLPGPARASLLLYRPDCPRPELELDEIGRFVEASTARGWLAKLAELRQPAAGCLILIVVVLFGLPHLAGMSNVIYYMEKILAAARLGSVEPHHMVVLVNVVGVAANALTVRLIDSNGRRFLLLVSSLGTTLALLGLGAHFYLLAETDVAASQLQWLPLVCIVLFVLSCFVSFTIVPGTVLGEIFPEDMKSVAALMSSLSAAVFSFAATKSYQPIVDALGEMWFFWIHACFALAFVPFTLFVLPETRKKSFQQIQQELLGR